MEKKVGIITFHAAHNYGSSLQSYALKTIYTSLGVKSQIINFRTPAQKDQYTPLTKRKGFKYILKNAFFLLNYKKRKEKYITFENFISTYLTEHQPEYYSLEQLTATPPDYDLYICGSDQIWNTRPNDASMAYFLPFTNGKKASYAPSFGPIGNITNKEEISQYLKSFDMLSVRELRGQELVKEMTGTEAPILVDPTVLLKSEQWDILSRERLVSGEYIFFYSLFSTRAMIREVREISRQLKLPVVVSNISNQNDLLTGFIHKTNAGPREFLSLVKHAKLVITSSFHGSVFSILYNKPFLVYNGLQDNRINTLLETTHLQNRSFSAGEGRQHAMDAFNTDYTLANELLEKERQKALQYIAKTLEL